MSGLSTQAGGFLQPRKRIRFLPWADWMLQQHRAVNWPIILHFKCLKDKLIRPALPRHSHSRSNALLSIMLPAALLQSECLSTFCINVDLTKHLPNENLLSVLRAAGGTLSSSTPSLSPSLSLTRNHLKLYWLWFASSALFPPVLCLCLGGIITAALCCGSFRLISLPCLALHFFFFPLYCCVLRYLRASTPLGLLLPLPWTLTEAREAR